MIFRFSASSLVSGFCTFISESSKSVIVNIEEKIKNILNFFKNLFIKKEFVEPLDQSRVAVLAVRENSQLEPIVSSQEKKQFSSKIFINIPEFLKGIKDTNSDLFIELLQTRTIQKHLDKYEFFKICSENSISLEYHKNETRLFPSQVGDIQLRLPRKYVTAETLQSELIQENMNLAYKVIDHVVSNFKPEKIEKKVPEISYKKTAFRIAAYASIAFFAYLNTKTF